MPITPATPEDVPQLCGLLAILFSQEVEFAPDADRQAAGLRAILSDPHVGAIQVAREGGEIVGMVNLLFTVSTFLGAKVALLEDMIVHPGQRGKGIGKALLHAAIERAKTEGCARITLLTDVDNAESKAFYRRAGFVESSMTPLRLMLPLGE
jgi:GNAT superfamily N-acetyltransferase